MRLLLLSLFLVLGCSPAPRRGNIVIFASGADLQSPNSLLTVHPLAKQVQRYCLLVTLIRYDSTLSVIPYLGRRWQWSPDRTTVTFTIFAGLKWHDGQPTTARDVAWTLRSAMDSVTGYPRRTDLSDLIEARATDDTTLILRFAQPRDNLPDVLTDLAILPAHLLDTIPLSRMREAEWNRRPVGNGPFRFVTYQPNRRWVFEANTEFPVELGGRPKLDRFVVAVVDEPTTKLAALTSGELDFAGINPAHAAFIRGNADLQVIDYPLLYGSTLIFNTRRPPFNNPAARQRVARAMDRRAVVDGVLFGYGTPADGPLPPQLAGLVPGSLPQTPLTGTTGDAASLQFELLTVGSGEAALEQMLQAQFAQGGIQADIRQLELATYLDRIQGTSHDFDAAVMGLSGDLALGHLSRLVALSGLPTVKGSAALLKLIADSLPAVYLYHARGVQGMNRRVRDVRMDIRGELATLTRWWIDAP